MDWSMIIATVSGAATAISGIYLKIIQTRTTALKIQVDAESELQKLLAGQSQTMRFQIDASIRKEAELGQKLMQLEIDSIKLRSELKEKDSENRILLWKLEAMQVNMEDVEERLRDSERRAMALKDELSDNYRAILAHHTTPPPRQLLADTVEVARIPPNPTPKK